ncbi:MarR family winged helix-turn-helix transcriptional regulator [Bifidobacterium saguinibicoloris]|uniref:MarR family winged helix-turn-helix transcriptional regulator n=1 Tax=Bifidobacterium saguinibicoloris TaxID=2834433 RepID=UPI001C5A59F8|nr:MarR family transcriptional regulator [Bifidobacterium saguinibicoloris]MBW3081697.1 MarR family transcriptional regulator [Bifidobacterium saguinibicoloris]
MTTSDRELVELFHDVARVSHQREVRNNDALAHGGGQSRCLLTLGGLGPVSQRRLAAILGIRSASMSELLGKMEARGWISRTPHPEDGRTYLVELTGEGRAEAMRRRSAGNNASGELLAALSEDQRVQFGEILAAIKRHYQELDERGA